MPSTANCGDSCVVSCPSGQNAWCEYACDEQGNCVCRGGCTQTAPSGFALPEGISEIFETIKTMFPEAPIDPMGPFNIVMPQMTLGQLAYILSARSPMELLVPAHRIMEPISLAEGRKTTFSALVEEIGLTVGPARAV